MGTFPDCQEGAIKTDTIGLPDVDILKKCIAIKRHRADYDYDSWTKDNTNLIFLLRDWREATLRHLTPQQRKSTIEINKCAEGYVHCLRFYDQFAGNKILVNYEDLLISPKVQFDRIAGFFNIERNTEYQEFIKNIKQHHSASLKLYSPGSATFGAVNKLKFHSRSARPGIVKIIDSIVMEDRVLFDKYLKRYEVK